MTAQREITDAQHAAVAEGAWSWAKGRGLHSTDSLFAVVEYLPHAKARQSKHAAEIRTERRGLMLIGGNGNGKSVALDVLGYIAQITFTSAPDMMQRFLTGGDAEFWIAAESLADEPIIIDDLGAEREAKSYGNVSPIGEWIMRRHARWMEGGPELHISTNLSKEAIATRYGPRVLDRLMECCIAIPVKGESMRGKGGCGYTMQAPNNRKQRGGDEYTVAN